MYINKIKKAINYIFLACAWIVFLDVFVFRICLNIGFPRYIGYDSHYIPAPYVSHVHPDVAQSYKTSRIYNPNNSIFNNLKEDDIKVAFFAGSTGILGEPKIADVLEDKLSQKLHKKVFVANFSELSATHRQHMHMLLEYFIEFKPDIIIFYGGYNEIALPLFEDPRPTYPYNFYYVEMPLWKKNLLRYSATFGLLEHHFGILSKINELRDQIKCATEEWNNTLVDKYFETFELSNDLSKNIHPTYLNNSYFVAFFQPFKYAPPSHVKIFTELTNSIEAKIPEYDYIHDVHNAYDNLDDSIWDDDCHVHGEANIKMAEIIANTVYNDLKNKNLLNKLYIKKKAQE